MWFIISILVLGAACAAQEPAPSALFFGDSICAGSTLPGGGPKDAWPALWGARNGGAFTVVNASRGGRPTASLDEFPAALAKAPGARLLVIALGANDSRDLAADMADKAVANLRQMIAQARKAGIARIVVVGTYDINQDALKATHAIGPQRAANLVRLSQAYEAMAKAEKVGFVAMLWIVPAASMTVDGVHPDKAGHEAIAKRFTEYMAKPAP